MDKALTNSEKQAVLWGDRFRSHGHLWGEVPSQTVRLLRGSLDELFGDTDMVREIVTVGAGTFRDEVHLAAAGAKIKAFEVASQGIELGKKLARDKGVTDRIEFEHKSFSDSKSRRTFDALLSHRTLHLLDDFEVRNFAKKAAQWVKPGGIIAVSARDFEDFDAEDMQWISQDDGVAEYTTSDREGHIVRFWNEAMFRQTFGEDFSIRGFVPGTEVESSTNSDKEAHFTIMLAQRKLEFEVAAQGKVKVEPPSTINVTGLVARAAASFMRPLVLEPAPAR